MPVRFRRQLISSESYESAGVWDVDGDGVLDIVCGAYWYQGPDFRRFHRIGSVPPMGEYWNDFSTLALDVDGDGRLDFVTGGWAGGFCWKQWPLNGEGEWMVHPLPDVGNIETTRAVDIDGDGVLEIVPNTPFHPPKILKLVTDARGRGKGRFTIHQIHDQNMGHGMGFGDVNGDGRVDIILNKGWLEQPAKPYELPWTFHAEFDLGDMASVPILFEDVNGDGLGELIVGNAHGYGLDWWQQSPDAGGRRAWTRYAIDPFNAQYHDLAWCDIDGDGENELVTGKRYRAHCGRDPGEFDDLGLYYFKWTGCGFAKQVIAYGPPGVGKGTGIHFAIADLRGSGRLDVVAPGKDGLCVFFNEGVA